MNFETCYMVTVVTIGLRSDCVAVLYALCLLTLLLLSRQTLCRIWPLYVGFLAVAFSLAVPHFVSECRPLSAQVSCFLKFLFCFV